MRLLWWCDQPPILESKFKWDLGSTAVNKARECKRIPVELFKTLKDGAIKMLHSVFQQIWKTQQWPQDWKRSICIPIRKKGCTKECANHRTIALIFIASKKAKVKVSQPCPTLCDPMDYKVCGILQVRILEWVAFPFCRVSSQFRDWSQVSSIVGRFFTSWATREAHC